MNLIKSKKFVTEVTVFGIVSLFLISNVSGMKVNYFYSPSCPHCNAIKPLIELLYNRFNYHNWNFYDVTQESYNVKGVPTIRIKTSDCREIELIGSENIERYLKCELQEMSTLECPTHLELKEGSYFIE